MIYPLAIHTPMPFTPKVKLVKIGNSLRMTIPVEVIEAMNIKEGDTLTVDVQGDSIVVKKAQSPSLQKGETK